MPKYLSHPPAHELASHEPVSPADGAPALGVRLSPPVENFDAKRITSPFGSRVHPGSEAAEKHEGIDIKARAGERILAAAAGTVAFAGRQHGYGNIVIIDHGGGVTTVYAHLFYACVRKGDHVGPGETIGRAGKRGAATGVHLHFEVRRGSTAINPLPYL